MIFHLLVYSVFVVLVAAEIFLRLRYRELLWMRTYPQLYVPDADLGYRYRIEAEGEICIPGIHRRFRTNNRGFASHSDFVQEKTPGTFRIAIVGTSNATGIWMNGQGDNYAELLEKRLRASGRNVEILNFGIDGRYRAVHEMRILETDVAHYEPDLVLIDVDLPFVHGYFMRDVYKTYVMIYNPDEPYSRHWCEYWIDQVVRHTFLIALYRTSYLVRALARLYMNRVNSPKSAMVRVFVENRIQAPDVVLLPYSIKRSIEALQAARDKFVSRGAELVVFQYFPNSYYQQVMAKYGLLYVELNVPPIPQFVHDLDGHYKHSGHVEIARQFEIALTSRALLGRTDRELAAVGL